MMHAANQALDAAGVDIAEVDWLVPHQASAPIVRECANRLGLCMDNVVLTFPRYGNTVGSWLLWDVEQRGLLKPGDTLLMCAVGAGMAWSASIYRWFDYRLPAA